MCVFLAVIADVGVYILVILLILFLLLLLLLHHGCRCFYHHAKHSVERHVVCTFDSVKHVAQAQHFTTDENAVFGKSMSEKAGIYCGTVGQTRYRGRP